MNSLFPKILFICLLFLHQTAATLVYGQEVTHFTVNQFNSNLFEIGQPHIRFYTPKEYGAHEENWWATQDNRGVMYFANGAGILEFDGVSWHLIQNRKKARGRSLDIAEDGTIYAGFSGDVGFLSTDSTGNTVFVSLMDKISESQHNFTEVWRTMSTKEGVYFSSFSHLFRWKDGQMHTWPSGENTFFLSYNNQNIFYIMHRGRGLLKAVGDSLQDYISEGQPTAVRSIFTLEDGRTLVCAREGFSFLKDDVLVPFPTQADPILTEKNFSIARMLPDGTIALGFYLSGIAIIDTTGKLLLTLDESSGVQNVKDLFVDREQNLWALVNSGIAKITWPSAFTYFGEEQGLKGATTKITRYQGKIVSFNTQGVNSLVAEGDDNSFESVKPAFVPEPEILFGSDAAVEVNGRLVIATDGSSYELYNGNVRRISRRAYAVHRSKQDTNLVYMAHDGEIELLRLKNSEWLSLGMLPDFNVDAKSIIEPVPGTLWIGTEHHGVAKVVVKLEEELTVSAEFYSEDIDLPNGRVIQYNGIPLFLTSKGLRRFDERTTSLQPDSTFGTALADTSMNIFGLYPMALGQYLISASDDNEAFYWLAIPKGDGGFYLDKNTFNPLFKFGTIYSSYPEESGVTWFGSNSGIVRYNPAIKRNPVPTKPFVSRVITIRDGAVQYGGHGSKIMPPLPYGANSLHFDFAYPSYLESSQPAFRYFLEGFDEAWSDWSGEPQKEYTGLFEGDYTLKVEAKNIYGEISPAPDFGFTILAPWYRSWWAYLIYLVSAGGFVAVIVKARVQQLEKRTHELEALVSERTEEIAKQADELKEMDRIKSRFFANISHEFRTPLTLILGPVQDIIQQTKEKTTKNKLDTVKRNANRLQRLIDQLLDLSQLEAGRMKLQVKSGNLAEFVKRVVGLFASAAERRNISLRFNSDLSAAQGDNLFDHDIVEKVLYNLLSNAIKYTPEGGEIRVTLQVPGTFKVPGSVDIIVKDTGVGIPAKNLPYIFDRFYQSENSESDFQEGTGIGLALTRELINLHRGEISVVSSENRGTEFIIKLPIAKSFFNECEIMDTEIYRAEHKQTERIDIPDSQITDFKLHEYLSDSKISILVVEDHREVREYIREHLNTEYHILEAENGVEGLKVAMEFIPNLVISDVMMPEMDGNELCKQLKTNEKISHIPVILLTAKASDKDKVEGLETGADDYLVKPFNVTELKARIQNLIEQRHKLREKFRREGLLTPRGEKLPSVEEAFLQRLMAVVEENFSKEEFGVEELSVKLHLGRRQLLRKLQALTGQTTAEFLRSARLRRARQMLEQKSSASISEIAFDVGFNNLSYFTKSFKDEFGVAPSELFGMTE